MKKFFRFILLIVNVLFAAAMLLSTLSGTFAPSRFAAVSILSYGYFVLLLCNVLFIIIWLCMGRWEFLVSVAAIALRFSFVPLFFQVGGTAEADNSDDGLRVMTFNTHGFSGLDSDTVMTRDSGAVLFLRLLDAEQPDVLCLQEFFIPPRMRLADSLAARGFRYHYGVHAANLASPAIIFSRYPFARVQDMDRKSKFCVDIAKGGQEYRVCCVHLNSYQLTEDDIVRIARRMLDVTAARMAQQGITLQADDDAVSTLAKDGFDAQYGARPLRRAIQNTVEDAVAEQMLEGKLSSGDTARVKLSDGKVTVEKA